MKNPLQTSQNSTKLSDKTNTKQNSENSELSTQQLGIKTQQNSVNPANQLHKQLDKNAKQKTQLTTNVNTNSSSNYQQLETTEINNTQATESIRTQPELEHSDSVVRNPAKLKPIEISTN